MKKSNRKRLIFGFTIVILLLTIILIIMFNQKPNSIEEIEVVPSKEKIKEEPKQEEPQKEETKKEVKEENITKYTEKYEHDIVIKDKNIKYESNVNDATKLEINDFLIEFYDLYFNILKSLEYQDVSYLFSNKENAAIYKTSLELLIETRKNNSNDLKIINPKYELTLKKYSEKDDIISFTILENCSYNFNFIKEYTTSVYNIENEFKLKKDEDGKYKITFFKKVQDFYVMVTDLYKSTENYEEALTKIKSDYEKKFKTENSKIEKMKNNYLSGNYKLLKADHEYDRGKAYLYATNWVGRRNTKKWHTYNANCVNFVSQVMYAGGIPMDHYGSEQWKWYSTSKNTKNEPKGFVYSWTYVPSITSYFSKNTGFGLVGKYDENLYLGDVGDVIVVGTKGPTRHVVSVISQIKDSNGKIIDLLVSSNTVDLIYFPLSAYAYPYKVLMKVYGYND